MCQYYGAPICSETNVSILIEKFTEWGFGGYLLYLFNSDGSIRNTPGVHAGEDTKQRMMHGIRNYIEMHCHRERHFEFLDECINIPNIKKLNEYDLLAACGWALYGSEKGFKDHLFGEEQKKYSETNILNFLQYRRIA